jgi:hypothetical protein
MDAQDIFNTVVEHLRKQNCKALLTEEQVRALNMMPGSCAYLSEDNKRCAAGILIVPEYDPSMEGRNIRQIIGSIPSLRLRLLDHIDLIGALQNAHDIKEVSDWEDQFKYVADCYGLVYTPPQAG